MPHIAIISASVRLKRNSHRVALYLKKFLEKKQLATVALLDLAEYNFPVFTEKLKLQVAPTFPVLDFAERVQTADGVIIVSPEYNGGYPASLKNAIDLLLDEWHRKPVAIATVSTGVFGGMNAITSLQYSLWKIQAWTVPAMFPVAKVAESYSEDGIATDPAATDKPASQFIEELLWCIEAKNRMGQN